MKFLGKITFSAFLIAFALNTNAQENEKSYDHWALDFGVGIHQVGAPLSPGFNPDILGQASLGIRYMFNERFGLRLDLGYNDFRNTGNTQMFQSNNYRATIEGVVNLGHVLKFHTWTNRFNVLAHGGIGMSYLDVKQPVINGGDYMTTLNIGLTPQFKLSNRISLFLDFSSLINFYQTNNFDGGTNTASRESNISLFNTSIGLSIGLGSNKQLADSYQDEELMMSNELSNLKGRLKVAENEIAALKVAKPVTDKTELIKELDNRYVKVDDLREGKYESTVTASNVDFIRELLNKGYINVYFDTNKTTIQKSSLYSLNYLKQFLVDNPTVSASLIGYADETGNPSHNLRLSENRAKTVFNVLVDAGISPNRLSFGGNGEDKSMGKNARQLARKVTFRIN